MHAPSPTDPRYSVAARAKQHEASVVLSLEHIENRANAAFSSMKGVEAEVLVLPLSSDLTDPSVKSALDRQQSDSLAYVVWTGIRKEVETPGEPVLKQVTQLDLQVSVYKHADGRLVRVHDFDLYRREPGSNTAIRWMMPRT